MTKSEFLDKLQEALGNDLNGAAVRENVDYYSQYIRGEVDDGRSEEEVIGELGDPWVIARTIIDAAEGAPGAGGYAYEQGGQAYGQTYGQAVQQGRTAGTNRIGTSGRGWWKLVLLLLGVIGVLLAVVAVVGGIISLVAPILVPVLIVAVIVRAFGRRR